MILGQESFCRLLTSRDLDPLANTSWMGLEFGLVKHLGSGLEFPASRGSGRSRYATGRSGKPAVPSVRPLGRGRSAAACSRPHSAGVRGSGCRVRGSGLDPSWEQRHEDEHEGEHEERREDEHEDVRECEHDQKHEHEHEHEQVTAEFATRPFGILRYQPGEAGCRDKQREHRINEPSLTC